MSLAERQYELSDEQETIIRQQADQVIVSFADILRESEIPFDVRVLP